MRLAALLTLLAASCATDRADDEPSIVGTWRWLPSAFDLVGDPDLRMRLVFAEDGRGTTIHGSGETETWTYSASDDRLGVVYSEGSTENFDIVLHQDRLLLYAMIPDGPVDGVVGKWSGERITDGVSRPFKYEFYADGYFYRWWDGIDPDESTGLWNEVDDSLELVIPLGPMYVVRRLDEDGIGYPLLERIDE